MYYNGEYRETPVKGRRRCYNCISITYDVPTLICLSNMNMSLMTCTQAVTKR